MKFRIQIIIILLSCLASCREKNKDDITERDLLFTQVSPLENLGSPLNMIISGNKLLISDFYGDRLVHLIDLSSGKEINRIVSQGEGPGEMVSPVQIAIDSDSLFIYSRPIFTIFNGYPIDNPVVAKKCLLPMEVMNVFPIGNGLMVASQSAFHNDKDSGEKRYLLLDNEGKILSSFGEYPKFNPKEKNYNAETLSNFHQTINVMPLTSDSFVALGPFDISFYKRTEENNYELTKMIQVDEYDYDVVEGTNFISSQTKLKENYAKGVTDATLWRDNIVLARLFSREPDSPSSIYFEIYDKDGNLKEKILPQPIISAPFCVTKDGKILAIREQGDDYYLMISECIPY